MEKYILIRWPLSQLLLEHKRFLECYLALPLDDSKSMNSTYFVPEDLYQELVHLQNSRRYF